MMKAEQQRPNIVLITFDDAVAFWRYKTVFGAKLQTPNLDRICAQSTAFHSAYCQSPICSPSRASFMSGKAPHQNGVFKAGDVVFDHLKPEQIWTKTLKDAGYFTSSGGKIIQGYVPLEKSIHDVLYCDAPKRFKKDWRVPRAISTKFGGKRGGWATDDPKHDKRFYDHQAATSAADFFDSYDVDAPFYREVGFYGPHGPWITPRRFKELYHPQAFQQPVDWANGFEGCANSKSFSRTNFDTGDLGYWRRSVRNYFSALSHVDHHLGRVWDGLKASKHADTTLVIIASDHGFHLGERDRFRKNTLWEQVANVPLIVHDPAAPKGQVVTDPVGLIDIGATVMDHAGLPEISGSPGRSLRAYCDGHRDPERAVPTVRDGHVSIRKGDYRMTRYGDGSIEFYDLARDWWQTRLLGPEHPQFEMMSQALAACAHRHGYRQAKKQELRSA